jgi:hypothetical protein
LTSLGNRSSLLDTLIKAPKRRARARQDEEIAMAVAEFKKKPEPPAVQHAGKISRHSIPISPSAESLWADIRKYGLEANIGELEVRGFTVVPPEKALPPGMAERLKAKIMDVAERRSGVRPDERAGTTHSLHPSAFGERLTYLLFEDQIFQDVMCNRWPGPWCATWSARTPSPATAWRC